MPRQNSALPVRAPEPVAPAPEPQKPDHALLVEEGHLVFTRGDRSYRVRGLEKNMSTMQLTVNILASRMDLVHLDTVDLVKARARQSFVRATASELFVDEDVIKKDLGLLLLQLEDRQCQQIEAARHPRSVVPEMSDRERDAAMELLRDPRLLERIVEDLTTCGIVGERTNKLVGYLAAVSRKLERPLAIVVQSSSSAGKTSLMDALLDLMPPEEQLKCTGLTGQSLYYLEGQELQHKILAISEETGIGEAAYALKLLQSEGELRHLSVGKNEAGRMQAQAYHVQGPVQLVMTTTSVEIDPELMNRALVLTVDESPAQTEAIHVRQRDALTQAGRQASRAAARVRTLHQHAQRLLRPVEVYNPYAPQLTFATGKTRMRRDHAKYLSLMSAVAFLHQHQREVHTEEVDGETIEYINVTPYDIEVANTLCAEVLGRSLDDLAPPSRRFLIELYAYATTRCQQEGTDLRDLRFLRREVREALGWSAFQVQEHLRCLEELEYVVAHHGRRGRQFVYELLYDGQGQAGEPFLVGLLDPARLHA